MNNGLLVIDAQEGFIGEETLNAARNLRSLLNSHIFKPVVFTRFINRIGSPHQKILHWDKMMSEKECQLWHEIADKAASVIDKNSYSALTPEFREKFISEETETIYLAGFDTDCCVLCTAADLFQIGIRPVILADYCASSGGVTSHQAGLTVLTRIIGRDNILSDFSDAQKLREYLNTHTPSLQS